MEDDVPESLIKLETWVAGILVILCYSKHELCFLTSGMVTSGCTAAFYCNREHG